MKENWWNSSNSLIVYKTTPNWNYWVQSGFIGQEDPRLASSNSIFSRYFCNAIHICVWHNINIALSLHSVDHYKHHSNLSIQTHYFWIWANINNARKDGGRQQHSCKQVWLVGLWRNVVPQDLAILKRDDISHWIEKLSWEAEPYLNFYFMTWAGSSTQFIVSNLPDPTTKRRKRRIGLSSCSQHKAGVWRTSIEDNCFAAQK